MMCWPNIKPSKPPEKRMRESWKEDDIELQEATYALFLKVLAEASMPVEEGTRAWFNDIYPFKLRAAEKADDIQVLIDGMNNILVDQGQ
jgi:hypothetical protein